MADSPVNVGVVPQQDLETETKDDCADCDDYSSGSDKSLDTDDAGSNCRRNPTDSNRSRRKRRHGSHGSRRHKGGSRHKHKGFHPYPPKDDIELQLKQKSLQIKEKENAAAVVRHEGAGQFMTFPVAPFNSTQFLMDEHSEHSPTGEHKSSGSSVLSSFSPEDIKINSVPSTPVESNETITFEKKDKEFTDFFTSAHAESLQSLPKAELVKHYINLEEKIAALQKKVAEAEHQHRQDDDSSSKVSRHFDKTCACDSISNSDANSLSSSNEEFIDFSVVNQPSICVGESGVCSANEATSGYSEDVKLNSADSSS